MAYRIFTDATADLTPELLAGLPPVEIIKMPVRVGDRDYQYGPGGNIDCEGFYRMLAAGEFASTSQINPETYTARFEAALSRGLDVVYLCFSSGLSGTIQGANIAAEELAQRYPERRILCIDTLCASLGEGFLVREAARMQGLGLDMDELEQWVISRRLLVCHWFSVDSFEHLRRGGRVGAAAAAVGSMLQIKPLLHVDNAGRLGVTDKPRGRKRAMAIELEKLELGWQPELGRLVLVGHGDCPEAAEALCAQIREHCPEAELYTAEIGPVIGAHTGPGMLAVLYWGSNR